MFSGLFDLIAGLLAWFYGIWPSYGMAIVFLTVLVMIVLSPLTISSTRQMIKMQRLQPELKRIQAEFRHDRQRMNEEVMRFYQENNVNPVGSCLPLLIQMPVFLILFRVLRGLTRRVTDVGFQVGAVTRQLAGGADVQSVSVPKQPFDPDYVDHSTDLYRSLADGRTEMVSWGIDLSETPLEAIGESFVEALPYLALIVLIGVLSWLQQKQIQGRSQNAVINPQQQILMKVLPFMLPIFSFGFPAGLLVYFVVSSLVRVGQQAYITKVVYKKAQAEGEAIPVRSTARDAKGGKGGARAASGGSSSKGAAGSANKGGSSATRDAKASNARTTAGTSSARRRRTNAGERSRAEQRRPDRPVERQSKGSTSGASSSTSRRVTPPGSPGRPKKKRK